MRRYFSLFIFHAMLLAAVMLSSCGAENHVRKGDAFYAIGEYYDAAAEYKKAYSRTATKDRDLRGERAWKMAECYRRINYNAKALGAYQNAIRYHYPDTMALFYLAQAQHKQGDYKQAIKSYDAFLELMPRHPLAEAGRQGCVMAPIWKGKPTLYSIKKEPVLNSRRADFSPALAGDESDQLYITSTRPQAVGNEISGITGTKLGDIFLSKKDDKGKWGQPEPIEGDFSSEFDEGACCFSPDGKTMYLTRCTFDPDYPRFAEICTSQRSDAAWSKPQPLQITKDTLSSYAHPAVSPDGRWLYFTSDMPGGMGGKDIWRIAISDRGLGGAENLGEPINTPGDEMFPVFRPNGDLYFSSNGHVGMGGLDIFRADCDSTGHWTVENLKYPMNSPGDDFGMTFEGIHNRGFFSTNRGDARGWDHIMSFECPEVIQSVKGWVYEKDGYELPEGLVYMVGNDGTYLKLSVRGDGSFEQEVKPNVDYVFLGTCKGYLNHKEELHVDTSSVSRQHVLQFPLASLNNPVLIRNVFYEFDSAELTDNSTQALDSLVDLLNENPNVTIELSSHCDYRGKDEYNERLSQRRAESVVNYLIAHGIEDERLTPVGYGEKRPKVVSRKVAEQNPFLHEGDTLTEQFILRLEDEQKQEVCNALNRRTEFKVLRTTYRLFEGITRPSAASEASEDSTKAGPTDLKPLLSKDAKPLDFGKKNAEEDEKTETTAKAEPKKDETPAKAEPKKDEVPAKAEPKKDETPAKAEPKKDESPAKAEPKKDEAPAKAEPKKDDKSGKDDTGAKTDEKVSETDKSAASDKKIVSARRKASTKGGDAKTKDTASDTQANEKAAAKEKKQAEAAAAKEKKEAERLSAKEMKAAERAFAREARAAKRAEAKEIRAAEIAYSDSIRAIEAAKRAEEKAARKAIADKKSAAKKAIADKKAAQKQKAKDRKEALKQKEAARKAAQKQKEAERKQREKERKAAQKQKEAERKAAQKQKEAERKAKEKQREAERKAKAK